MVAIDAAAAPASKNRRHTLDAGFRPDIEALRGVAVLCVLLFHFQIKGAAGGFVGVDIFFVISGYLITRIILLELDRESFSYARFWIGRIRRLFPALVVTVVASFAAASLLLAPHELKEFARSAVAALGGFSNVYFWSQVDYFDAAAATKPLLHTWSLAIEAQFYLVWPFALILLYRWRRPAILLALAALFALPVLAAEHFLRDDAAAPFFLLPFRIGEFVAGAALCWLPPMRRKLLADFSLVAGLLLILLSVVFLGDGIPFPGLHSVPVIAGAALVMAAVPASRLAFVVDNAPLRWIGRISYSLYLVHWPLLVFAFGLDGATPDPIDQLALVAVSLALGAALHRFVELPLRANRTVWPGPVRNAAFAAVAAVVGVPTVGGLLSAGARGWVWRCDAASQTISENFETARADARTNFNLNFPNKGDVVYDRARHAAYTCTFDLGNETLLRRCLMDKLAVPSALIIGDSHGREVMHALRRAFPNRHFVMLHQSSCVPATYPKRNKTCFPGLRTLVRDLVATGHVEAVVLASRFSAEHFEVLAEELPELLAISPRSAIVGPGPWLLTDPPLILSTGHCTLGRNDPDLLLSAKVRPAVFTADDQLEALAKQHGVPYVRKLDAFCSGRSCRFFASDGLTPLFHDQQHLTRTGMAYLAEWFRSDATLVNFLNASQATSLAR